MLLLPLTATCLPARLTPSAGWLARAASLRALAHQSRRGVPLPSQPPCPPGCPPPPPAGPRLPLLPPADPVGTRKESALLPFFPGPLEEKCKPALDKPIAAPAARAVQRQHCQLLIEWSMSCRGHPAQIHKKGRAGLRARLSLSCQGRPDVETPTCLPARGAGMLRARRSSQLLLLNFRAKLSPPCQLLIAAQANCVHTYTH